MLTIIAIACITLGVAAVLFSIWFVAAFEVPKTTLHTIAAGGIAFAAAAAWLGFGQNVIFLVTALVQASVSVVSLVRTLSAWPSGALVRRAGPRVVVRRNDDGPSFF